MVFQKTSAIHKQWPSLQRSIQRKKDTSEEGTQKEKEDFFVIEDSSGSQVPLATAKEKFNEQPKMQ